jgi:hypothetical protein
MMLHRSYYHHCCSLSVLFDLLCRRLVYQSAPVGMSTCITTSLSSSSSDRQVLPWTANVNVVGDDHQNERMMSSSVVDLEYLANGHTDVPFRIEVLLRQSKKDNNDNDNDNHNDNDEHDGFLIGAVETTLKGLLAARCSSTRNMKGRSGSVVDTILSSSSSHQKKKNTTSSSTIPDEWKTKMLEVVTTQHGNGNKSTKPSGHIVILDASTSTYTSTAIMP